MIRVVVVDDHPLVREAVGDVLAAAGGISVVARCADGGEVAEAVARTRPDVLLLDVQMPQVDGLTAARGVRASHPEVRIVFLSAGLTPAGALEARAIGAVGYLLKDDDPARLAEHLRAVARGGTAWHPRVAALLDGTPHGTVPPPPGPPHGTEECPPHLRPRD